MSWTSSAIFRHDDHLFVALLRRLERRPGPNLDDPATGLVGLVDPFDAVDEAGRGEIRSGHDGHQVLDLGSRVLDHHQAGIDHFAEVVRRDVRGHADGNAGAAVHEKIGELGGKDARLAFRAVVIRDEVDGLFVDVVPHELFGQAGETHLGITHGRRVVAIDGAEVSLAVDEAVPQGEVLGHPHHGVVDGAVAVRVVLAHDVADDACRLLVGLAGGVALLVHAKEHAAVYGLETVADVGQRAADDDRHRIVEIRLAHLIFDVDRYPLIVELGVIVVVVVSHAFVLSSRARLGRHSRSCAWRATRGSSVAAGVTGR